MKTKYDNYKKIKGLMFWAKQTFINEKGMEIMPTLENLTKFNEELTKIKQIVDELYNDILKEAILKES